MSESEYRIVKTTLVDGSVRWAPEIKTSEGVTPAWSMVGVCRCGTADLALAAITKHYNRQVVSKEIFAVEMITELRKAQIKE